MESTLSSDVVKPPVNRVQLVNAVESGFEENLEKDDPLEDPKNFPKIQIEEESVERDEAWYANFYKKQENVIWKKIGSRYGRDEWQCLTCCRSLSSFYNLKSHVNSHMKFYPYKCDRCDKKYTSKNVLIRHQKRHALQAGNISEEFPESAPEAGVGSPELGGGPGVCGDPDRDVSPPRGANRERDSGGNIVLGGGISHGGAVGVEFAPDVGVHDGGDGDVDVIVDGVFDDGGYGDDDVIVDGVFDDGLDVMVGDGVDDVIEVNVDDGVIITEGADVMLYDVVYDTVDVGDGYVRGAGHSLDGDLLFDS